METELPEDINKAAEEYVKESLAYKFPTMDKSVVRSDIIYAFKQGAKWMAEQGETIEGFITKDCDKILGDNLDCKTAEYLSKDTQFRENDKVIVNIRKK